MTEIAPGWYKDPAEPTNQRYWDGEGWIGEPVPVELTPPPGPPPSPPRGIAPPARPAPPPARPAPAPAAPVPAPPLAVPPGTQWAPGRPVVGGRPYPHLIARPYPHGLPVAPLGLRVLARLIDLGVLIGLNVLGNGWLVYLYLRDIWPIVRAALQTGVTGQPPDRARFLMALIPVVTAALWLAYEVPAIAQRGQTFGKRVVGIKVLRLESTEPLGFARALRRWNPLGLPVLLWICGLGFILQFVDAISPCLGGPLQLALHDRSAGTVVVHVGRKGHEIAPLPVPQKTGELP